MQPRKILRGERIGGATAARTGCPHKAPRGPRSACAMLLPERIASGRSALRPRPSRACASAPGFAACLGIGDRLPGAVSPLAQGKYDPAAALPSDRARGSSWPHSFRDRRASARKMTPSRPGSIRMSSEPRSTWRKAVGGAAMAGRGHARYLTVREAGGRGCDGPWLPLWSRRRQVPRRFQGPISTFWGVAKW